MEVDFTRDHAMYAVIFGIFSAVWFAIALEKPPKLWKKIIYAGIGTGLLLAIVGGVLMYFYHSAPSALGSDETWRLFCNTVIVEFVACSIGVAVLNWRKKPEYIAAWIAFVVAAHFIPLVFVFQDLALYVLAGAGIVASIIPLFYSKRLGVTVSTLTGVTMGTLLMLFAIRGVLLAVL